MTPISEKLYRDLTVYYGDLHNHCDMSYGHGTLQDAIHNARLQLDFASVTIHAVWPDLPVGEPNLEYLVDYHRQGFARAKDNWSAYLDEIDRHNQDNEFITFPSFEWHSMAYGDYCIYYKNTASNPIIDAPDLPALRRTLHELGQQSMLIPHHIGYKQGFRGINWGAFSSELSPVAEIFSFHGASETSDGPYPYLHSMGPRHEQSTAQYGWAQGHIFGVVGSTDHHNAFPGSYGYGRLGVWADSLNRDAIWDAIHRRRTYALTGDRIALQFMLNDQIMGSIAPADSQREIAVSVNAGSSIDYIDVLHNNRVIHRENVLPDYAEATTFKLHIEMGWGEQAQPFDWQFELSIDNGSLLDVEPRLRGYGPTANPNDNAFAYTQLERNSENSVCLKTKTRQNPALHTAATEGVSLEITGTPATQLNATINGQQHTLTLGDLQTGSRTLYTGGFVSPSICFHRAVPRSEYEHQFTLTHQNEPSQRDWYYIRVHQRNGHMAWSSPIWVDAKNT